MPLCRAKAAPISSSEDFSKGGRGMQSENRMFDDFVKVLNGAAGTFAGMGREAEANFRERVREWVRSEEHTSELQSLMRISYAVFCLKKKTRTSTISYTHSQYNYKQNRT